MKNHYVVRRHLLFFLFVLAFDASYSQSEWALQKKGLYGEAVTKAREEYAELSRLNALPDSNPEHLRDTLYARYIGTPYRVLFLNDHYEEALQIAQKSAAIWERSYDGTNKLRYLIALRDLAQAYAYSGYPGEAEATLDKMVDIGLTYPVKVLEQPFISYLPYTEVTTLYQFIGRLGKAEIEHQKAVTFYYQHVIQSDRKINNLANSLINISDYSMMERYFYAVNEMAVFYQNTGHYHKHELLLRRFEEVATTKFGENSPTHAIWISQIVVPYAHMGRFEYAEENLKKAEKIFSDHKKTKKIHYSHILNNHGIILMLKGEFDLAEKYFNEAISIASKKGRQTREIGGFHHFMPGNLAGSYLMQGRLEEARSLQEKNMTLYKNEKAHLGSFIRYDGWFQTLQLQLGICHLRLNQLDSAEKYLTSVYRYNLSQHQRAYTARMLARLYKMQSNYTLAREYYNSALQTHLDFLEHNFFRFSELERADLFNEVSSLLNEFNAFATQYSSDIPEVLGDMYNYQLLCKSVLFYSSREVLESIMNSGDELLIAEYRKWKTEKDFLFKVYQMSDEDKHQKNIDQLALEEDLNELEKALAVRSQAMGSGFLQKKKTWLDINAKLLPGEAAVEIIRIENKDGYGAGEVSYAALLITASSTQPMLILLQNGNELEGRALRYYSNYVKLGSTDPYLYEQYWDKIASKIGRIKTLYFAPDGVYNKINLNTLYNSRTKKYLIEELELITVMNTKEVLSRNSQKKGPSDVHLFGFPDYDGEAGADTIDTERSSVAILDSLRTFLSGGRITKLPGTRTEVLSIESGLVGEIGVTRYLDGEASETNLKKLQSPNVVHIATHGFFLEDSEALLEKDGLLGITRRQLLENPLFRSGLLLAGAQQSLDGTIFGEDDGILTSYEAMNLQLFETDLVVLSACETGLGDIKNGEGVYGLQRAFQAAGANAVLMSLWRVDDNASQELMTTFYKQWLLTGNKQKAFISAQKILMKKYKAPFFWGAFVMMGE